MYVICYIMNNIYDLIYSRTMCGTLWHDAQCGQNQEAFANSAKSTYRKPNSARLVRKNRKTRCK